MRVLKMLLLAATLCGAMSAATVLSISPSTETVGPGQTFTLDVLVSGAADLYAFQFDIGFNPAILAANSITEGAFLPGAGGTIFFPGTIDNVGGTITFNADSLVGAVSGASGAGTLATLSFTSLGAGSSSVGLFNASAFDSFGEGVELETSGGTVNVSGVPEPGSALPLSLGLLALTLHFVPAPPALAKRKLGGCRRYVHTRVSFDVCSGDLRVGSRAVFSGPHDPSAGSFSLGRPA